MNENRVKNLKNKGIDLSVGTLNFLANVGLVLPYVLILSVYHESTQHNFLIALVIFYIARAGSIFYTKRFNLTSGTYLGMSIFFGAFGSLVYALTTNIYWLSIASILWGYSAAIIWPYFLTVKLHIHSVFKLKRVHWLIFGILGLLFGLDILADLNYKFSFIFLSLLYLIALPSCLWLHNFMTDFQSQKATLSHFGRVWRTGLFIIFFGILGVLTALRKASFSVSTAFLLGLVGVAFIILLIELYADRKAVTTYKFELLNRGFLTSFVLLFNGFLAQFIFGHMGMYIVFGLYLIGFELGNPVLNRLSQKLKPSALQLAQICLIAGHVLILIPTKVTYALGLLMITFYVGYDNPILNQSLFTSETDSDRAIVHKYRFSTYGGLFCQVLFFGLLIGLSSVKQVPLLEFFTATTPTHSQLYFFGLNWPIALVSLILSLKNIKTMALR